MDEKIFSEVRAINQKVEKLESKMQDIYKIVDMMYQELGIRKGEDLHKQLDELFENRKKNDDKINQIERDVQAIRAFIQYSNDDLKEIKQALALIYRNTDELEPKLLKDDRSTY